MKLRFLTAALLVVQSIMVMLSITSTITYCQFQTSHAYTQTTTSKLGLRRDLHPVVLVPGNGGNQLEARLNSDYQPSSLLCKTWHNKNHHHHRNDTDPHRDDDEGWYRIWFDPTVVVAPFTKCFSERMMLYYDPVEDDYRNAPGVETRVPHFGSTKSLLYLDPSLKHTTAYMAPLVDSLTSQLGYLDGATLFGAPYDFRYGLAATNHPSKTGSKYLQDLKQLIEHATDSNNGKPTIIISHSLGGLISLHFLLRQDLSWRRRYVRHLITLSAPWGGTVQEMLTFASGYTLGVPLVQPLLVREEQRSSESNLWLMPSPAVFGKSEPLVITVNKSYTAGEIGEFLNDLPGFEHGDRRYKERILPLVEGKLEHPGVAVSCVVGSGVRTPETLFYYDEVKGFDVQPEVVYGDGDGSVNMVSLLAVQDWWGGGDGKNGKSSSNQSVEMIKVDNVSHTDVLKDKVAIDRVLGVVNGINSRVEVEDLVSDAR